MGNRTLGYCGEIRGELQGLLTGSGSGRPTSRSPRAARRQVPVAPRANTQGGTFWLPTPLAPSLGH
jgi:hypothetical protein